MMINDLLLLGHPLEPAVKRALPLADPTRAARPAQVRGGRARVGVARGPMRN